MAKHLFKKGEKGSKEHSERLRLRNKINNPMSNPQTIEKMRQTKLRKFNDGTLKPSMQNKHHSEKTKEQIRKLQKEIWKDKKLSPEIRRKTINARTRSQKRVPLNQSCEICNSTNNLQRHHWTYEKPLLVNTLCQTCHEIQHVKNFSQSKFGAGI